MLTEQDVKEIEKRLEAAGLQECFIEPYKTPAGVQEYDITDGNGADRNSVAVCYDKEQAEFMANAALDIRLLIESYRAVLKDAEPLIALSNWLGFKVNLPKVTDFYKSAVHCVYVSFGERLTLEQEKYLRRNDIQVERSAGPGANRYCLVDLSIAPKSK